MNPTHSQNGEFDLKPWKTLKEAISDLPKEKNQACAVFPENVSNTIVYLNQVKIGEIYLKIFKKKLWVNLII